jgi:hypothetical protein
MLFQAVIASHISQSCNFISIVFANELLCAAQANR